MTSTIEDLIAIIRAQKDVLKKHDTEIVGLSNRINQLRQDVSNLTKRIDFLQGRLTAREQTKQGDTARPTVPSGPTSLSPTNKAAEKAGSAPAAQTAPPAKDKEEKA